MANGTSQTNCPGDAAMTVSCELKECGKFVIFYFLVIQLFTTYQVVQAVLKIYFLVSDNDVEKNQKEIVDEVKLI